MSRIPPGPRGSSWFLSFSLISSRIISAAGSFFIISFKVRRRTVHTFAFSFFFFFFPLTFLPLIFPVIFFFFFFFSPSTWSKRFCLAVNRFFSSSSSSSFLLSSFSSSLLHPSGLLFLGFWSSVVLLFGSTAIRICYCFPAFVFYPHQGPVR